MAKQTNKLTPEEIAKRREIVCDMLQWGHTEDEILTKFKLARAQAILDGKPRDALIFKIDKAALRLLKDHRVAMWKQKTFENLDMIRGRDLITLDRLMQTWAPKALDPVSPDEKAVEIVLKLMDRRAKLVGMYTENVNVNIRGTVAVSTIEAQLTEIIENNPELLKKNPQLAERFGHITNPDTAPEPVTVDAPARMIPKPGQHTNGKNGHHKNGKNGNGKH